MANPTFTTNTAPGTYAVPGAAVTVSNVAGLPTGGVSGHSTIRSADMSIWDNVGNVYVRPEQTNEPVPNQ